MTDYKDLINALREADEIALTGLRNPFRFSAYYNVAADAIEELIESNTALNGTISNLLEQFKTLSPQWISVKDRLPNEDKIIYNSIGEDEEITVSDKVLAIYPNGDIYSGYFMKSGAKHPYHGKGKTNEYSRPGIASWEFGELKNGWIVSKSASTFPTHWMPLPKPPKGEEK